MSRAQRWKAIGGHVPNYRDGDRDGNREGNRDGRLNLSTLSYAV
jgi:hypothetical protein